MESGPQGPIDDQKVDAHNKIEAIGKLLNCTGQLELYDCIPLLNAIREYGCGYHHISCLS